VHKKWQKGNKLFATFTLHSIAKIVEYYTPVVKFVFFALILHLIYATMSCEPFIKMASLASPFSSYQSFISCENKRLNGIVKNIQNRGFANHTIIY
jgi:hypothetical protein